MIRENGATSGAGVLGSYAYDDLGRRTSLTRGNGVVTSYGFDAVSRLTTLTHDPVFTANDLITTLSYSPAGQIAARTINNDLYAYAALANRDTVETANGLNQLVTQSPSPGVGAVTYDARGNVATLGGSTYIYDAANRLKQRVGGPADTYVSVEPASGLLLQVAQGAVDTRFDWSGARLITEIDATVGQIARRYVHGTGTDEVLTWYEGSGTSDRRWLLADERGSTVGITDGAGAVTNKLAYDDYGIPASSNVGRIQYTGQAWLPELGMHYYKARIMNPAIGRFMQSDPIGYAGGVNLYAYVGGDPMNMVDPSGLANIDIKPICPANELCVFGQPPGPDPFSVEDQLSILPSLPGLPNGYDIPSADQTRPVPQPRQGSKKPNYCSRFGYRFADTADRFAGVGQKFAIAGFLGGIGAAITGAGLGLAAGSARAYTYASTVRFWSQIAKGYFSGTVPTSTLITTGIGRALTPTMQLSRTGNDIVSAAADVVYGETIDKAQPDPCKD